MNRRGLKIKIGALLLALITAGTILTLKRHSKTGRVRFLPNNPEYSTTDGVLENDGTGNVYVESSEIGLDNGDSLNEENTNISISDEFENIAGEFSSKNSEAFDSISTSDITKFIAIANIDYIVENDDELAQNLFSEPSKEEYLNDAAKVIGAIVMHNYNIWSETNSTEQFIKVSDVIMGEQQDKMRIIEDYVDKVAEASINQDTELVNKLVAEFLNDMNSGELSKLDDGVGFASAVHIAVISDIIARNYLNEPNFDMLQVLKSSEKYISNIFAEYDKCADNAKTLSR